MTEKLSLHKSSYLVALLGARMNYAVPRILEQSGQLAYFYTDFFPHQGWSHLLKYIPPALRPNSIGRLLERTPQGIPPEKIIAFNQLGISYGWRLRRARNEVDLLEAFLWSGQKFCELILETGLGEASAVFTFNSAGLELLQTARQEKRLAVMEQTIAPKAIEWQLLQQEQVTFPKWATPSQLTSAHQRYIEREKAEWQNADYILCGSDFVRQGIIKLGGPSNRCAVVPYGVDPPVQYPLPTIPKTPHTPLRVLTIGTVGLRKGSPYILAAAKMLKNQAVFRIVGNLQGVPPDIQTDLSQSLELIGSVRRSEIWEHYTWADVFLLPSICEGSATVVYEALSQGLPIICTPNTGSVVRHNIDGLIIKPSSSDAVIEAVLSLIDIPDLVSSLSINAYQRAQEFTMAKYSNKLLQSLSSWT